MSAPRIVKIFASISERVKVEHVDGVAPGLGPCWTWQGPTSGKPGRCRAKGRGHSYPRMNLDGHTVAVHRIAWQCVNGPISPKRQLDHLCRNRLCVAPTHCEAVTHKVNQKRKVK